MNLQTILMIGAALFCAVKLGWLKWPPTPPTAPVTPDSKPLTVAEAKALFADHGLECKHKPPEIKDNGDGSVTITGLSAK